MIWLIGLGGSLGAAARYLLSAFIKKSNSRTFPVSTWTVNIAGSFLLGLLANLHMAEDIGNGLWLFLGTGFCGAFTTFSTFGHEAISLLQSNRLKTAVVYVVTSVVVGIGAAAVGFGFNFP